AYQAERREAEQASLRAAYQYTRRSVAKPSRRVCELRINTPGGAWRSRAGESASCVSIHQAERREAEQASLRAAYQYTRRSVAKPSRRVCELRINTPGGAWRSRAGES